MARSLFTPPWMYDRQGDWARPPAGIPATNSSSFWTGVVQQTKWAKEIHIVLDNLSAHKTKAVEEFLAENPQRPISFHADLLFMVQSSRDLVRQDSARRHRPRRFHFG